jgi:hypothetical protein
MFTLEVLTGEAQQLLQIWRDNGVDLRNFEVVRQQGYRHIRCLHNVLDFDFDTFSKINSPLQNFIRNNNSPFILVSDELSPCTSAYDKDFKHIFLNGSISDYMVFEWPEQIMRYRAALLLQITG